MPVSSPPSAPASKSPEQVLALARIGVDVFRLNFSHGVHEDHAKTYAAVRAAEAAIERPSRAFSAICRALSSGWEPSRRAPS